MRYIIILLLLTKLSFAISPEDYVKANNLYSEQRYEEALSIYKDLKSSGIESSDLLYNMGNTYFRLSQVGLAILHYKKAIKLNPWDGDIEGNLKYAEENISYEVELTTGDKVKSIAFFWYYLLNMKTLITLTVVFALIMWTTLILKLYRRGEILNWVFYLSFIVFAVFSVSSMVKYYETFVLKSAIVIAKEINVRSSANEKGIVLFNLHEGAEVKIIDKLNSFYRIELNDSKGGWVKQEFLGVI